MLLTQLTTVKTRLGISDTTDDTLLTNLIQFASARFKRDTNRALERAANTTEEFPPTKPKSSSPVSRLNPFPNFILNKTKPTAGSSNPTSIASPAAPA